MFHTVQPRTRRRFNKGAKIRPFLAPRTVAAALVATTLSFTPRAARADIAAATADAFINLSDTQGWSFDKVSAPPRPQSQYFTYSVYTPSWTAHAPSTGANITERGLVPKFFKYDDTGGFHGVLTWTIGLYAYGFITSSQSQEANSDASYSQPYDSNNDGVIDGNDEPITTSAAGGLPQVNGSLSYTDSKNGFGSKIVAIATPIPSFQVDVVLGVRAFALVGVPPRPR